MYTMYTKSLHRGEFNNLLIQNRTRLIQMFYYVFLAVGRPLQNPSNIPVCSRVAQLTVS